MSVVHARADIEAWHGVAINKRLPGPQLKLLINYPGLFGASKIVVAGLAEDTFA